MLSSKDGKNKSTHLMIIMFIINFLKNLTCYLFSFISVYFIIFVLDLDVYLKGADKSQGRVYVTNSTHSRHEPLIRVSHTLHISPRIPSVVSRTAWWNLSMWCWNIAWLQRSKYIRPKNQCHLLLIMETMPERPWANARMIIILAALYLVYFVVFAAYAVYVPFFPSEVRYRYINSAFSCTESVIDLQWFIIRSLHFPIKRRMCWLRLT